MLERDAVFAAALGRPAFEIFDGFPGGCGMKLLLGDLTLTGEGKRFSLTALIHRHSKTTPKCMRNEIVPDEFDCVVAKIWGYAHNANEAGREGVGCATMMMRCAL